ncbi:MAG: hypothetical protein IMZ66_06680 [Planctomycetes bacterium]|nr:hypothetical protein [Planctomycetota bacterium]
MTVDTRKRTLRGPWSVVLALLVPAMAAAAPAPTDAPTGIEDAKAALAAEAAPSADVKDALKGEVTITLDKTPPDAEEPVDEPAQLAPGQKEMTLDEIKDLPILRRLDIPYEKGEALLSDVKDETFGYGESAFYWLVDKIAKMPLEAFKPDAEVVPYSALLSLPSGYRGTPVTVRGVYIFVTPFRTPVLALRKDVPVLYECTIREHPIDEERPIATVLVTEDPMPYLRADDFVVVKGYFYKVRKYAGTKGESICPMLVARRLELEEQRPGTALRALPAGANTWWPAYVMAILVGVMGIGFLWMRQRTKAKVNAPGTRPIHRFHLRRPDRPEPPADAGPRGEGGEPKP